MPARRHITDDERRRRLVVRQHLAGDAVDVLGCTRALVALHSSDPLSPYLSLAARVDGFRIADLDVALIEDRSLWRLHAMRRTLWIVPTDLAGAVLAGTSADVAARERRRLHRWVADSTGHDPETWVPALEAEVDAALAGGAVRTTRELGEAVPELATTVEIGSGRWATTSPISSRLLFVMAMDGRIARAHTAGSWRASQYAWAAAADWFGERAPAQSEPADAAAGRAEVLVRWLAGFGPATTADVRWWTGWTARQTATALAACGAVEVTTDVGPAWVAADDEAPPPEPPGPVVTLLPALDPTSMGWKERGFLMGELGRFDGPLFDRNGNAGPMVLLDGRVVGGWAQVPSGEVVVRMLSDVGAEAQAAAHREAAARSRWLDGVVVTPRFRTPLERALTSGADE